jgi:CHAT domain-containing protein/tetratricopeptide (TPR) repeat protein
LFFLFLFFSGDEKPAQKATWVEVYQPKDQLHAYLEKLYDLTDEQPFYFSNKADSLEQSLWRQPKSKEEQTAYLDFILNIAYHLLQQGQIQASTRWYEKGLNYQQQQSVPYEQEEYIVKPLGNNYVRLGDYDKAVALQQTAITNAVNANKFPLLSSLYSNLAISYYWLGNYAAAQEQCNKGLQYVSFQKTITGLLYNVKADAFYATDNKDSSSFYNQKAIAFYRTADAVEADASWIVSALQLSSKLLADKQQWQAAVLKLQNAEKILEQTYPDSRQRDKAKLKAEKGNLFLQLKQTDSSKNNFKDGLQFFSIHSIGFFPDQTVTALYAGLARSYKVQLADSSLFYYQLSVANDYYCNQLITSSANSLQSSSRNEEVDKEAIQFFHEQYQQTNNSALLERQLWLMELSKGRKLLNEQNRSRQWLQDSTQNNRQQLFSELRNDYLLLAEAKDVTIKSQISERIRQQELALGLQENRFAQLLEQPSFAVFQKKLREVTGASSFVSYSLSGDSFYVLLAAKGQIQSAAIPAIPMKQQIDSFMQVYFSSSSSAFANNPISYFTTSNQVLKKLLPFETSNQPLIISADATLHRLPFEALNIDGKQQFLGETNGVSYVYSFLQYVQTTKENKQTLPVTVYTFRQSHSGFAALPSSVMEAKQLQKEYKATVADATSTNEIAFTQSIQSSSVLHIASHAVADSAQQPYLVLKQKFYLGQLQYIVTASPMVVLTACETAAGSLQDGEGVASIGRAFISKGVKAVVASRWKVDDAVAPVFIQSFYTSLQQQHSPVTALHETRKQYLSNTTSLAQKNPLLWAGFSYIGVDQQIKLQTPSFNWYWLLLLLFLPIGFYFLKKVKR